jgi:hypothetical protein
VQSSSLPVQTKSELNEGTYGTWARLGNADAAMTARIFVRGEVLYQITLSGTLQSLKGLNERDFFSSFQPLK